MNAFSESHLLTEPLPDLKQAGDASAADTPLAKPDHKSSADWTWVPIRSLGARHRGRIGAHLLALNERDRYLRFGHAATDAQVSKYVDTLDFERDEIFGIFNRRLHLVAMAHLAHSSLEPIADSPIMSEFGVSVSPKARGRGYGRRLFERAMLHARNRGVDTLFIHALSENIAMLKIARNAGAVIERNGPESEAWLKLPPDTVVSHVEQLVERQAAEIDFRLKVHAHQFNRILKAVGGANTDVESKDADNRA
jgi:GNAT superfamily N-acetyltransferase